MVNNIKGIPRLRPLELADRVYYTPQSQDIRSRRYWCTRWYCSETVKFI